MDNNELNMNENESMNEKTLSAMAQFEEFDDSVQTSGVYNDKLHFLKDLPMNIYIELGRTQMQIKDILELERGYVIELDKLASEPVDVSLIQKNC
jgi:Flagellar motor switch/type III secretory pathway protein